MIKMCRPRTYSLMFNDWKDGTNITVKIYPQQKWSILAKDELFVKVAYKNIIMRVKRSDFEKFWQEIEVRKAVRCVEYK